MSDAAPPANENAISLSDLAKASGIDEDTMLQRLAGILGKRPTLPPELIDRTPRCAATGDPCPGSERIAALESELSALRAANAEMREKETMDAAYKHVETMVPKADDKFNLLWHGWALREAFVAGARWWQARAVLNR